MLFSLGFRSLLFAPSPTASRPHGIRPLAPKHSLEILLLKNWKFSSMGLKRSHPRDTEELGGFDTSLARSPWGESSTDEYPPDDPEENDDEATYPERIDPDGKPEPPIWRIPQELRDMIYELIFGTTRLSHGETQMCCGPGGAQKSCASENIMVVPHPQALALLRTCKRITDEIGLRWISQVLFNFEDLETMMHKLSGLDREKIIRIRHVRLKAISYMGDNQLRARLVGSEIRYSLTHYLSMLSGLQPECLTIFDSCGFRFWMRAPSVTTLLKYSQGWKQLRIISENCLLLSSHHLVAHAMGVPKVRARTTQWSEALLSRDGKNSKPSVELYRCKPTRPLPHPTCLTGNPSVDYPERFASGPLPASSSAQIAPTILYHAQHGDTQDEDMQEILVNEHESGDGSASGLMGSSLEINLKAKCADMVFEFNRGEWADVQVKSGDLRAHCSQLKGLMLETSWEETKKTLHDAHICRKIEVERLLSYPDEYRTRDEYIRAAMDYRPPL